MLLKKTPGARLSMACPFCGEQAKVQACKGKLIRGAKDQAYYWRCTCMARGYFPDAHFKRLDKLKKITIAI
jgi:hypothetical protein